MIPLPNIDDCQTYAGEPLQYRPVLFYFSTGSQQDPLHSAVLCTPSIAVASVSIEVNLASNVTTVTAATDITPPANMTRSVYNGLFFDEGDLDSYALSRLEGVQEQLPSAIFLAAKVQDPTLTQVFKGQGFANITAAVYVSP